MPPTLIRDAASSPGFGENVLPAGTLIDGRFRIEQALDTGSLAQVYRATELPTRRVVALKLLEAPRERHSQSRALARELKAIRRLSHANIAQVYEVAEGEAGRAYIAMEYLDGETLRRYLRRRRILSAEEMLPIALQIADALAAAHAASVLHRDLKPENVFIDRTGRVKVADFGTARLLSELHHGAERGVGIGTPAYMAPERLIEAPTASQDDPRSDLYSLGILEYEMLAGYNPVLGDQKHLSRTEVSWRQASVPPRVPVGVPLEVWSVLEPTLRKEPDRRPASAREHSAQLQTLVSRLRGPRGTLPAQWALPRAKTPGELWVRRTVRSVAIGAGLGFIAGSLVFLGWWFGSRSIQRDVTPLPHQNPPALEQRR